MRSLAYGICALLTAAVGDVVVEALQNAGRLGTSALDANHQGVVPVLGIAALLLATLAAAIARDRFRQDVTRREDRPLELAREIARSTFGVRLLTIVGWALVIVFATEEYERAFGGALPFDVAHARIDDALACLGVYVACATVITIALGAAMRAIVGSCDVLLRIVVHFAALADRADCDATHRSRVTSEPRAHAYFRCAGPAGDRAPPSIA